MSEKEDKDITEEEWLEKDEKAASEEDIENTLGDLGIDMEDEGEEDLEEAEEDLEEIETPEAINALLEKEEDVPDEDLSEIEELKEELPLEEELPATELQEEASLEEESVQEEEIAGEEALDAFDDLTPEEEILTEEETATDIRMETEAATETEEEGFKIIEAEEEPTPEAHPQEAKKIEEKPAKKELPPKKVKKGFFAGLWKAIKLLFSLCLSSIIVGGTGYAGYQFVYLPHKHLQEGIEAIYKKDFIKAEKKFKEGMSLIHLKQGVLFAYNEFGKAYLRIGANRQAEDKFKQALKIDSNNISAQNSLIKLHLNKGNLTESERMCKELIRSNPKKPDGYITLAQILLETHRPEGAVKMLKYALSVDKKNLDALCLSQRAFTESGKYKEALSTHKYIFHLTKGKELYYADDLIKIGKHYMEKGNLQTALEIFGDLIKYKPEAPLPRYYLAKLFLKEGKKQAAIKQLEICNQVGPKYAPAYLLLGEIYYQDKKFSYALPKFQKAALIKSKDPEVYKKIGHIFYYDMNAYQEAADCYKQAVKYGDNSKETRYNLGVSLYHLSKYEPAMEEWHKLGDKDDYINYNLTTTYLQMNKTSDAEAGYLKLIDAYKSNILKETNTEKKKEMYRQLSKIYNNLGVLYENQEGTTKRVVSSYWQAMELISLGDGENKKAYDNLNRTFNREALPSLSEGLNDLPKEYIQKVKEKPKDAHHSPQTHKEEKHEESYHPSQAHKPEEHKGH